MQAKIQRWGNSLGIRIPRSFAAEARVGAGSSVDLSVEEGTLLIRPLRRRYALRDLLKRINSRNRHAEVGTGASRGREAF